MLSLVFYDYRQYDVLSDGEFLFRLRTHRNPYHQKHLYLDFPPECLSAPAGEVFPLLWREFASPMQVMVYADDPIVPWLLAGGFVRKRRCLELTVTANDLMEPLPPAAPLSAAKRGSAAYDVCCKLLYDHYTRTHQAISPLTASLELFSGTLPETVLYQENDREICHYAFAEQAGEEWEIAYTGSLALSTFSGFAQALLSQAFREGSSVTFECDDCDPVAQRLKAMFRVEEKPTFDTFTYAETSVFIRLEKELTGSILDIGGGGEGIIGRVYGHQVIAIDNRQEELDEAPDCCEKRLMDAAALDFPDETFDHVTAFFSMMFMDNAVRRRVIQESARVLRPGGQLHIWDTVIDSACPEPFCVELDISLPDEHLHTTYGILSKDARQDSDTLIAMGEDAGFLVRGYSSTGTRICLCLEKELPE